MKILIYLFVLVSFLSCFEDQGRMMVDGKMEPPAPDESENNETIGGIDSNNDGVRDDIERWINRKFPGEENYNKRMGFKQYARTIRDVQMNATSKEKAIKYLYEWNEASDCLSSIYIKEKGDVRKEIKVAHEIKNLSSNTNERLERRIFADKSFAGKAYASPPNSKLYKLCDFDVK